VKRLLLHAERKLVSIDHHLVGRESFVEHLLVVRGALLRLLDGALLQIVVHQLIAFVQHRLRDCHYLLLILLSRLVRM